MNFTAGPERAFAGGGGGLGLEIESLMPRTS